MIKRIFKSASFVLLVCLIIEIFLQFFGDHLPSGLNSFYLPQQQSYRPGSTPVLFLGDSITAWGLDSSYPALVQRYLDKAAPGKYFVTNGAKIGETSSSLIETFKTEVQKIKPKIVVSMIGLNDYKLTEQKKIWQHLRIVSVMEHLYLVGLNSIKGLILGFRKRVDDAPAEVFSPSTTGTWKDIETEIWHYLSGEPGLAKYHAVLNYLMSQGANSSQKSYYLAIDIANAALAKWPKDSYSADMRGIAGVSVPVSPVTEEYLKAAIELQTDNPLLYVYYAKHLNRSGKREEGLRVAKALIKKESGLTGRNKQVIEHEFPELKEAPEEKVYLNPSEQNAVTAINYQKLYKLTSERKIFLMILPYPMTAIDEVKQSLSGLSDVEFLDYKNFFENSKTSYSDYFVDHSAVTFGHLTTKSNEYVAKAVAESILARSDLIEQERDTGP